MIVIHRPGCTACLRYTWDTKTTIHYTSTRKTAQPLHARVLHCGQVVRKMDKSHRRAQNRQAPRTSTRAEKPEPKRGVYHVLQGASIFPQVCDICTLRRHPGSELASAFYKLNPWYYLPELSQPQTNASWPYTGPLAPALEPALCIAELQTPRNSTQSFISLTIKLETQTKSCTAESDSAGEPRPPVSPKCLAFHLGIEPPRMLSKEDVQE